METETQDRNRQGQKQTATDRGRQGTDRGISRIQQFSHKRASRSLSSRFFSELKHSVFDVFHLKSGSNPSVYAIFRLSFVMGTLC